ncbi:MAG: enoyl-CoA hydratase/isomerase family protein, partial [Hyphomicrobium sp.]|nr:enoyl-CoA hydratase/isomerase family protein [Hyphomicrobium sp.]
MTEAVVHVKSEDRPSGRVATVTIDNQRRLNCLASATIISLTQTFKKLSEDNALRAIILTGAGDKAFIGVADLNELGACCADSVRL